jgi:hypothetical protein
MPRQPKTPNKSDNETVEGFSITGVIILLFLLAMFLTSTVYVLVSSLA